MAGNVRSLFQQKHAALYPIPTKTIGFLQCESAALRTVWLYKTRAPYEYYAVQFVAVVRTCILCSFWSGLGPRTSESIDGSRFLKGGLLYHYKPLARVPSYQQN